jgi:hypothetical protein
VWVILTTSPHSVSVTPFTYGFMSYELDALKVSNSYSIKREVDIDIFSLIVYIIGDFSYFHFFMQLFLKENLNLTKLQN